LKLDEVREGLFNSVSVKFYQRGKIEKIEPKKKTRTGRVCDDNIFRRIFLRPGFRASIRYRCMLDATSTITLSVPPLTRFNDSDR
jgi:hypothetical protein